jgi:transcriptional regulator with XRE-family HTH domain
MKKVHKTTFDDLVVELEKDAEFRKADRQIKPYYDLLAEIIRRRRELNITQEELAARTEMRQSSIARLEAGEHNARLSTLIKIAEALEARLEIRLVPVYYVEDDEEKKRITNPLPQPLSQIGKEDIKARERQ